METFRYIIVKQIKGKFLHTVTTNIFEWAESNGHECVMMGKSRLLMHPALHVQPQIKGLHGPMFDGVLDGIPCIRYEDKASYKEVTMSARDLFSWAKKYVHAA